MALHARLFKHNILRISKLKKFSHTSQAIERKSEKNTAFCERTTNSTPEGDKLKGVGTQHTDLWPPSALQWSPQHLCLDLLDVTLPACQQPMHNEGLPCLAPQPNLDMVTNKKLKSRKKSLTAVLFPQDHLPLVVKSVSYTTDDIVVCPMDKESQANHGIIYENHLVTILTCKKDQQKQSDTESWISHETHTQSIGETEVSVLRKSHFQKHFICDSNPTRCQAYLRDSSGLQCGMESGSDTVFCRSAADFNAVLQSSGPGSDVPQDSDNAQKSAGHGGQGPNMDQLKAVETYFVETLPKFFKARLDYRVYHPDIIFENNFWGENQVSVGINQYAVQMTKLRAMTHLKYAHVHMEVISSTCVPEKGVIRIQWRIVGLSQLKALRFWKYTTWGYSNAFREDSEWLDGISILHINKDGLVTKHRMDRMTPDEGQLAKAPSLAAKLALLFGLFTPKTGLSDYSSILCRR